MHVVVEKNMKTSSFFFPAKKYGNNLLVEERDYLKRNLEFQLLLVVCFLRKR